MSRRMSDGEVSLGAQGLRGGGSSTAHRLWHVTAGASAADPATVPRVPRSCVCVVCVGGGVAGGADGADSRPRARPGLLPHARLGLPGSTSLINQVPGSASGEADPRQMPSAGSQARTRGEWGHGRGQVCPQQEEEGRPSRDSKS